MRLNPDTRRRALERATATGDLEAEAQLLVLDIREKELPLENVRMAAFLGDKAALRVTEEQIPAGETGLNKLFKATTEPRSKRRQHLLACGLAWAAADSCWHLWEEGFHGIEHRGRHWGRFDGSILGRLRTDPVRYEWCDPDDWEEFSPEILLALSSGYVNEGRRRLSQLHRYLNRYGGDVFADAWYLAQVAFEGEITHDVPEEILPSVEWSGEEIPTPNDLYNMTSIEWPMPARAALLSYAALWFAARAVFSKIGSAQAIPLFPQTGWLRDMDLPEEGTDGLAALLWSCDVFKLAVCAHGHVGLGIHRGRHLAVIEDPVSPEAQNTVEWHMARLLIPRLLGRERSALCPR